jgi:hypothetical protein
MLGSANMLCPCAYERLHSLLYPCAHSYTAGDVRHKDAADNCYCIYPLLSVGCAGGSVSSAAGGSRLEDELVITLNKALAQANPGYKRIGIMGMLALLQQEGVTYELLLDADGAAAGEWCARQNFRHLQEIL